MGLQEDKDFEDSLIDLSNTDFSGWDLRDLDLRSINFSFAKFKGAKFYGADLSGADLRGSNFSSTPCNEFTTVIFLLKNKKVTEELKKMANSNAVIAYVLSKFYEITSRHQNQFSVKPVENFIKDTDENQIIYYIESTVQRGFIDASYDVQIVLAILYQYQGEHEKVIQLLCNQQLLEAHPFVGFLLCGYYLQVYERKQTLMEYFLKLFTTDWEAIFLDIVNNERQIKISIDLAQYYRVLLSIEKFWEEIQFWKNSEKLGLRDYPILILPSSRRQLEEEFESYLEKSRTLNNKFKKEFSIIQEDKQWFLVRKNSISGSKQSFLLEKEGVFAELLDHLENLQQFPSSAAEKQEIFDLIISGLGGVTTAELRYHRWVALHTGILREPKLRYNQQELKKAILPRNQYSFFIESFLAKNGSLNISLLISYVIKDDLLDDDYKLAFLKYFIENYEKYGKQYDSVLYKAGSYLDDSGEHELAVKYYDLISRSSVYRRNVIKKVIDFQLPRLLKQGHTYKEACTILQPELVELNPNSEFEVRYHMMKEIAEKEFEEKTISVENPIELPSSSVNDNYDELRKEIEVSAKGILNRAEIIAEQETVINSPETTSILIPHLGENRIVDKQIIREQLLASKMNPLTQLQELEHAFQSMIQENNLYSLVKRGWFMSLFLRCFSSKFLSDVALLKQVYLDIVKEITQESKKSAYELDILMLAENDNISEEIIKKWAVGKNLKTQFLLFKWGGGWYFYGKNNSETIFQNIECLVNGDKDKIRAIHNILKNQNKNLDPEKKQQLIDLLLPSLKSKDKELLVHLKSSLEKQSGKTLPHLVNFNVTPFTLFTKKTTRTRAEINQLLETHQYAVAAA